MFGPVFCFNFVDNGGDYMLDDYKESQFISYSLIKNSIENNKLSHAYLIDANRYEKTYDFVMAMVKAIICNHHTTSGEKNNCDTCNICMRIADGNYPEVKIIETDGLVIKKEQLLELQSEFSRSSIEGKYRIYIIKDCDKMNKQASNCLLKFLEEPVPGIIAILVTNQLNRVLSTIISRCQLIRLQNVKMVNGKTSFENFALLCSDNDLAFHTFLEDDTKSTLLEDVLSFVQYYEENGLDILIFMKKMWYNKISSREDAILAFLLIMYFYYDVLKFKVQLKDYFFCDQIDLIQKISDQNCIDNIVHKLNVINYGYEMLQCNLNVNLLMDDIVIKLGDKDEYCRS